MPRPTPTEARLAQLEADVATLAQLLVPMHGARADLLSIIERNAPEGRETRPSRLPEQRAKAVA